MTPFHEKALDNGLLLRFFDRSNRYFGDYHRLCIEIHCAVPVAEYMSAEEIDAQEVHRFIGTEASFHKTLEQMGVAGADVKATRERLLTNFLETTGAYLARPEFPRRFLAKELARRKGSLSFY